MSVIRKVYSLHKNRDAASEYAKKLKGRSHLTSSELNELNRARSLTYKS